MFVRIKPKDHLSFPVNLMLRIIVTFHHIILNYQDTRNCIEFKEAISFISIEDSNFIGLICKSEWFENKKNIR